MIFLFGNTFSSSVPIVAAILVGTILAAIVARFFSDARFFFAGSIGSLVCLLFSPPLIRNQVKPDADMGDLVVYYMKEDFVFYVFYSIAGSIICMILVFLILSITQKK